MNLTPLNTLGLLISLLYLKGLNSYFVVLFIFYSNSPTIPANKVGVVKLYFSQKAFILSISSCFIDWKSLTSKPILNSSQS